ncbi:unnamed protein product [Anisakis simplex]|uniref:PDZ domain-containing protein n=1 Tax=Anisakis simplex TaxID=6269 RepID=A0A158PN99_ANISI|nr:unnamed protein product [Anisakis simplex]
MVEGESNKSENKVDDKGELVAADAIIMMDTVTLSKPFRVRIKKSSLKRNSICYYYTNFDKHRLNLQLIFQAIYIEPRCQSAYKVAVGDKIIAIDGIRINKWDELVAAMRKPTTKANVTFQRRAFSVCDSRGNTVETLMIKNDPKVMRAIQLYSVRFVLNKCEEDLDEEDDLLGLQVTYDAKERLQIVRTNPDSLSAIHLRSGDIIREVDGHAVASKTMLNYWIMEGIEQHATVCLSIESAVDTDEEEGEDLPEDVVEIAKKQLEVHRSLTAEKISVPMKPILRKNSKANVASGKSSSSKTRQHSISISNTAVEIAIASDFDSKTLKRVKKGQH